MISRRHMYRCPYRPVQCKGLLAQFNFIDMVKNNLGIEALGVLLHALH